MQVAGIELETLRRGEGPPLLLLHGFDTVAPDAPFLDRLAGRHEIIAPSAPGFGDTPRPKDFTTVYDLVHLYLALIDALPEKPSLLGLSFGGWLAAEIAALAGRRIEKLVLVDALGVRLGDRDEADIFDIFNAHPRDVAAARWREPADHAPDFDRLPDAAVVRYARNREALCLYGWQPYMHNPRLKRWLARIAAPTLVLWGEHDGIVAPAYGEAYAGLIPGARFERIANAAHHPEAEQPDEFAARVLAFLEG